MNKDLKELIRDLKRRGWYVTRMNRHIVMKYIPGGQITLSISPSDTNWMRMANRQIKKIEEENGPYILNKDRPSDRGLSYQKPSTEIVPTHQNITTLEIISQHRETKMPEFNKEIVIKTMKEKLRALRTELAPYMAKVKECQEIENVLKVLGDDGKTEEEKIQEHLAIKKPTKVSTPKPRVNRDKFYAEIVAAVTENNGKMRIVDLVEWMEDGLGYTLRTATCEPRKNFMAKMIGYHTEYPEKVQLEFLYGPDSERSYEYVILKKEAA